MLEKYCLMQSNYFRIPNDEKLLTFVLDLNQKVLNVYYNLNTI